MKRFENRQALVDKIEWEGDLSDAVAYGIRATDMPEGDAELVNAWTHLETTYREFEKAMNAVRKLLPDDAEV